MLRYSEIYKRLLVRHHRGEPMRLRKSQLPERLRGCTFDDLVLLFETPNNKLHGREEPDVWVIWLEPRENL